MDVVRDSLRAYADRGVFRGFNEVNTRSGQPAFRFVWLIDHPMELALDEAKGELRFKRLLPGVPADSALYIDLKEFIRERHAPDLPEHRRVDQRRAQASFSNRQGTVSLSLRVKDRDYAYGVNRIVNLVHELFVHLRESSPEYLMENFNVPQD